MLTDPVPATESRVARLLWPIGALVVTVALALVRLMANPSFYFADDSQFGSLGQWWKLGDELLAGRIPVLDPAAWQAGNYAAEGQWGLLSPFTWLIAVIVRGVDDAVLSMTVVKIAVLAVMALGVHLLARSFGAAPVWAALAAVLVPLSGFTVYMDAPSWSTGLLNAAVLPWAWWGLRRITEAGRGPVPYLIASWTLITFGYVFGVLVLVAILVETLVRAVLRRAGVWRALAASAWGALITVAVYLPGLLTAPVTIRADWEVTNSGFLNADLSDLGSAASPTAVGSVGAWWGSALDAPITYIAWVLPLLPLFLPARRDVLRRLVPVFVVGGAVLLVVIGPSHVGPLRWPVRMMPYVALCAVIVFVVLASARQERRPPLRWAMLAVAGSTYLAYANAPTGWRSLVLTAAVQVCAVVAARWILWGGRLPRSLGAHRPALAVTVAVLTSAVLLVPQLRLFPSTPLLQSAVPQSVPEMQETLRDGVGEGIAVGDVYRGREDEASYRERLIANLWYLSPTPVSSLYTVLPHAAFSTDLCLDLRGATCGEGFQRLFAEDETTGMRVVDLMGVSTVVAMKGTYPTRPQFDAAGWTVTDAGPFTWLVRREDPVPGAGSVVWSGPGTDVAVTAQDDTSVTFTVDAVGDDRRVVLSRLDYPGYRADGAELVDPVRGWLLTVELPEDAEGTTVTVSFHPPGAALGNTGLAAAGVLGIAWVVVAVRRRLSARPADG